jgi:hypothetical protein
MKGSILAGLTFLGCANAEKAGISVGIDHEFIRYFTDTVGPILVDEINSIIIPEWSDDNGDSVTKAKFNVIQGDPKDFSLNYNPTTQSIDLDVKNIMGHLEAFLIYVTEYLITAHGLLIIDLVNGGLGI